MKKEPVYKIGILFLFLAVVLSPSVRVAAQPAIPPVWDVLADDFEGGSLAVCGKSGMGSASLLPGGGYGGVDTRVANNIVINNEAAGLTVGYAAG